MDELIAQAQQAIADFYAIEGYNPKFLWLSSMVAKEEDVLALERSGLIGTFRQDPIFETWGINWIVDKITHQ